MKITRKTANKFAGKCYDLLEQLDQEKKPHGLYEALWVVSESNNTCDVIVWAIKKHPYSLAVLNNAEIAQGLISLLEEKLLEEDNKRLEEHAEHTYYVTT